MWWFEDWTESVIAKAVNSRSQKRLQPTDIKKGLGRSLDRHGVAEPFDIGSGMRLRHVYVLGATGSGKTNLLIQLIEADLRGQRTAVVLDLRGDLIDRIVRLAVSLKQEGRIRLIDLRRPGLSCGINPFQATNDPYSAALHMHAILRASADSWGVQLDETLRCSLIALSTARSTLTELPRFLTDDAFRESVLLTLADPHAISFFERFNDMSRDRKTSWALPVLNKVSPFLSHPAIRAILAERPPINIGEVLNSEGDIVLVALGADRLHGMSGTFGCLMVSVIENAAMQRVDQPESQRSPVHLYLDEFENFQSPAFESIIAEGRRFRLGLTLSHQNLHQLDTKLKHSIINNASTRIYFRTGHLDSKELSSELGQFGVKDAQQAILHLPVGRAFVIGEAKEAQEVQFHEARSPEAAQNEIQQFLASLATHCDLPSQEPELPHLMPKQVKHVRKPRAAKDRGADNAT